MFNFRRIWKMAVLLTSLVTLLPLIFITTIDYNFTQKSIESENLLRTLRIGSNAKRSISFFLSERLSALSFIVRDNNLQELLQPEKLNSIAHQSPRQLQRLRRPRGDRPKRPADQLCRALFPGRQRLQQPGHGSRKSPKKGFHISEVFLGFRNVPHLIIAVKYALPDGSFYVLRAAIDTTRFNELLRAF